MTEWHYVRFARLIQHLKVVQCNLPHVKAKEENINNAGKETKEKNRNML